MANSLEGKTVLWVEDDNFLGGLIAKKLTNEGANVMYTSTGEDALEQLKDAVPHFILADILLPGKDGFEVLEFVKNDERLKDIPVILFSNLNQEEDMKKGRELGAEAFFVKSNVVPEQVIEKIKEILSERQNS